MSLVLTAAEVLLDGRSAPGWVEVAGERLVAAGHGPAEGEGVTALGDVRLLPGLVDMHVHGGGGGTFTTGDPAQIRRAADWHRSQGTTSLLASLVSAAPDALRRQVEALADAADDGVVAGIHLEGPWLAPGRRGAHDPSTLRDPTPDEIDALLAAARGHVRMVTIAPERTGGIEAVRRLCAAGVVVAIGHTDADHAATQAAIDAGASVATHLCNAMPPLHHREPGPVLALLDDRRVTVELVADGLHLHPAMLAHLMVGAGSGRTALVTDAMAAAGMPDGDYDLGGLPVTVRDGSAHLADGTIAGSTATMARCFRAGAAATDPDTAAIACTSTPARAVGLEGVGTLAPGARADLVVVDEDGTVQRVMAAGAWLDPPA